MTFFCKGKEYNACIDFENSEKLLKTERENWFNFIKNYDSFPKNKIAFQKEVILNGMKSALDDSFNGGLPSLSIRLDILICYVVRRAEERNRLKRPYNPESKSKRNDGIDFLLTFAFILPALLCTCDKKISNSLKMLPSFQSRWIYRPEELASAWLNKQIVTPVWP
jgi:hypothetical protein